MMSVEDRPTIAERYLTSVTSSNLRVTNSRSRGDIDYVAAAGMLKDDDQSLGALLIRMLGEWDGVRGQVRVAMENYERDQAKAQDVQRSVKVGPTRAQQVRDEATAQLLMARYEAMRGMTKLRQASEAMGLFARHEAQRQRLLTISDKRAGELTGAVVHALMEPRCPHCAGRGFNGSPMHGEAEVLCKKCVAGLVKGSIGSTHEERQFSAFLHSSAERKIQAAVGAMALRFRSD